jgi:putative sigma-54 modulation protein
MKYTFIAKNNTISEALKEMCIKKINKIEKLLPQDTDVHITFSVTKLDNKVEVTIPLYKRILKAKSTHHDMYANLDLLASMLEKQIKKYKSRLRDKSRKDPRFKEEFEQVFSDSSYDESVSIDKIKKLSLKPMDIDEAVMEMELLGHSFYMFINSATDKISVVYKKKNSKYGLIESE